MAVARALLPRLREIQDYVWRRHLAANADRLLSGGGAGDRRELAVGFADLVGYTSRSRGMGGRELGAMVEDFESIAAEVIARHGGRVVKTVGDGVLFTAATAVDAVEIGLDLPEAWAAEERPPLRVGAAYGAVLTRLGDVYSPVVNLASRLTSLARPDSRAGRQASWPNGCGTGPVTGCGRCAGCRCAATSTCSRGWSAAARRGGPATRAARRVADDGYERSTTPTTKIETVSRRAASLQWERA